MELWFFLISISFCLCLCIVLRKKPGFIFCISLFVAIFNLLLLMISSTSPTVNHKKKKKKLPPGPPASPFFGNLLSLKKKSVLDLESFLRQLHPKYGPILTIRVGPRTMIFISDPSLAHKLLIQRGSVFSDRPPSLGMTQQINTSNQHTISSAACGPLWRLLRRNLVSGVLHPSTFKSYSHGREWVLKMLIEELKLQASSGEPVFVFESIQNGMFFLLLQICFGQQLDQSTVKKIENVQRRMLNVGSFDISALLPKNIGKMIFPRRWNELLQMRREKEELFIPLIRARKELQNHCQSSPPPFSYVDSLLGLELPEEGGRNLTEGEMVSLCSEFLTAGTDTTTSSLQWIMANLVKYQKVQQKLVEEIERVVGKEGEEVIMEEDLNGVQYLKAVVMEGLRRHPPSHFVVPHTASEEITLEEYTIPKDAMINFMVAEMGWDEKVWEEPKAFRPERFLDHGGEINVDITGRRGIKMMPFGAGRRICPAINLAMLHLQYFVANLVRFFVWKPVLDGEEVDLSEKMEFTVVMKNPLKVKITRRT